MVNLVLSLGRQTADLLRWLLARNMPINLMAALEQRYGDFNLCIHICGGQLKQKPNETTVIAKICGGGRTVMSVDLCFHTWRYTTASGEQTWDYWPGGEKNIADWRSPDRKPGSGSGPDAWAAKKACTLPRQYIGVWPVRKKRMNWI